MNKTKFPGMSEKDERGTFIRVEILFFTFDLNLAEKHIKNLQANKRIIFTCKIIEMTWTFYEGDFFLNYK